MISQEEGRILEKILQSFYPEKKLHLIATGSIADFECRDFGATISICEPVAKAMIRLHEKARR